MLRDRIGDYLPDTIDSEEMRHLEANSAALGIGSLLLMENAGARVADYVAKRDAASGRGSVLVVAGPGNNGGDGFVAARHLANAGFPVVVVLMGRGSEIRTEEARTNWEVLEKLDVGVTLDAVGDSAELDVLQERLDACDLVVDAMLGTGVRGSLRQPLAGAVRSMNASKKQIIAIDTPTGLDPSTGEVHGVAIRAAATITFHKRRRGLARREEYTGEVVVADIGIPVEAELFAGPGDVMKVITPRKRSSSKRDFGYVLVVGGSDVYSGAPALAGLAALRVGAGVAIVAAPTEVSSAIRATSPALIVNPLPGGHVGPEHLEAIDGLLERVDSLVLGPGIGLRPETGEAVGKILRSAKARNKPVLVDADALKLLEHDVAAIDGGRVVLTPNAGEFKTLTGIDGLSDQWPGRIDPAVGFARDHGCVLLLKGGQTIVTDGKRLRVNRTGNPAMSTGGTGDVLSGIIGAFLAQGRDPFSAAVAGAFINGRAGDSARLEKGYHAIATDLIEMIPGIMKPFDREG